MIENAEYSPMSSSEEEEDSWSDQLLSDLSKKYFDENKINFQFSEIPEYVGSSELFKTQASFESCFPLPGWNSGVYIYLQDNYKIGENGKILNEEDGVYDTLIIIDNKNDERWKIVDFDQNGDPDEITKEIRFPDSYIKWSKSEGADYFDTMEYYLSWWGSQTGTYFDRDDTPGFEDEHEPKQFIPNIATTSINVRDHFSPKREYFWSNWGN
jgi:hypothetical protein